MNEDAAYRTSSQYRFWSYTPAKLAQLRADSNVLASKHMFEAARRRKALTSTPQLPSSTDVTPSVSDSDVKNGATGKKDDVDAEALTVEEEVELLKYYCNNLLVLGSEEFKYPIHVTATAIQFLKRFYLTHSLMQYAPKKIMPTALFLANKTDNQMHLLDSFLPQAHKIRGLESLTRETVLGPEFLFTQALRFHFDVRHPYRALKGITLEAHQLIHICHGHKSPEGWARMSGEEIRDKLLDGGAISPNDFERRVLSSYDKAKEQLSSKALISDAYFHYSPSQIAFAAWHCIDAAFIHNFLDIRLTGTVPAKERHKIIDTVAACAEMLQNVSVLEDDELRAMNKKMIKANKINAQDVAAGKSKKRPANEVEEHKAKKRKLEREAFEKQGNDLFGPSLVQR